jgi:signal peptidase I
MNKKRDDHKLARDLGFSLLAEGTILKIRANGYSMYPSIKPGSIIFIDPLRENTDPLRGEMIAWKRDTGFIVHRLIRTEGNGKETVYFTRGDSCAYEDSPVTRDQIAGKVIRVENRKKKIREEETLIKKPCYSINRINVFLLLKIKRLWNILFK